MYCKNCGAYNDDDANFCGNCGQYIEKQETAGSEIIFDVSDGEGVIVNNTIKKYEDGWFFKGIGFAGKTGVFALGVFLTFMIAAIIFTVNYPDYASTTASYISRFFR